MLMKRRRRKSRAEPARLFSTGNPAQAFPRHHYKADSEKTPHHQVRCPASKKMSVQDSTAAQEPSAKAKAPSYRQQEGVRKSKLETRPPRMNPLHAGVICSLSDWHTL